MGAPDRISAKPAHSRRPGIPYEAGERTLWGLIGQSKEHSAWPAVHAATDPHARGGEF